MQDWPELNFNDNIELEDFISLPAQSQVKFSIDMNQFNEVRAMKLPYVFDGTSVKRFRVEQCVKQGFWSKLILNGSARPIAKENATLMPIQENGVFTMYLLGGSPMITGQFMFEIYKINPSKQTWAKVEYERPIVQTVGSRPLFQKDPTGHYKIYVFSG